MHEYAVTESMLEIIESEAARSGATRVRGVTVALGELSSFVGESIAFYFTELSRGTLAEGATLVFQKVEARAACIECGTRYRPRDAFDPCPECNSPFYELQQGQEFFVESINVD